MSTQGNRKSSLKPISKMVRYGDMPKTPAVSMHYPAPVGVCMPEINNNISMFGNYETIS